MNLQVFSWYLDQIIAYIGLAISIVLSVVVIKKLRNESKKKDSTQYPLSLQIFIYSVYISSVFVFISLIPVLLALPLFRRISPSIDQTTICKITYIFVSPSAGLCLISIFNLFIQRLCISFKDTAFEVSNFTKYTFRIIVNVIYFIESIFYYLFVNPSPYNIYTQSIDYNGNGITCNTHTKGDNIGMTIVFIFVSVTISSSNIIVWSIFMVKLYKLLKCINSITKSDDNRVTKDFIILMKEQTMLISIAVSSSVTLWTIQIITQFGQACAALDFIVNIIIVFLTLTFNRYYFELLKCHVITAFCCKWFEQTVIRMTNDEIQLSKELESQCNTKPDI